MELSKTAAFLPKGAFGRGIKAVKEAPKGVLMDAAQVIETNPAAKNLISKPAPAYRIGPAKELPKMRTQAEQMASGGARASRKSKPTESFDPLALAKHVADASPTQAIQGAVKHEMPLMGNASVLEELERSAFGKLSHMTDNTKLGFAAAIKSLGTKMGPGLQKGLQNVGNAAKPHLDKLKANPTVQKGMDFAKQQGKGIAVGTGLGAAAVGADRLMNGKTAGFNAALETLGVKSAAMGDRMGNALMGAAGGGLGAGLLSAGEGDYEDSPVDLVGGSMLGGAAGALGGGALVNALAKRMPATRGIAPELGGIGAGLGTSLGTVGALQVLRPNLNQYLDEIQPIANDITSRSANVDDGDNAGGDTHQSLDAEYKQRVQPIKDKYKEKKDEKK